MKKSIPLLTLLLTVLAVGAIAAEDSHAKVALTPNGDSGVSGFVQLTQLPHGGTNIHVMARGLHAGTVYASFYYDANNCSGEHDLLGTFTAESDGNGEINGKIDDDLDEVGSVSVRIGPDYGTLLACATVH